MCVHYVYTHTRTHTHLHIKSLNMSAPCIKYIDGDWGTEQLN